MSLKGVKVPVKGFLDLSLQKTCKICHFSLWQIPAEFILMFYDSRPHEITCSGINTAYRWDLAHHLLYGHVAPPAGGQYHFIYCSKL